MRRWAVASAITAVVLAAGGILYVGVRSEMGWSKVIDPTNEIHGGEAPDFPNALPGWRRRGGWSTVNRAFSEIWTAPCVDEGCASTYTATMNGCGLQRFLVRWRALGDPVLFGFGANIRTDPDDPASGYLAEDQLDSAQDTGWADLDGCTLPLWQATSTGRSNLVDVAVEVQLWVPTA